MKSKLILYGAGALGKEIYDFMEINGLEENIIAFCDKNADGKKEYKGKKIYLFEEAKKIDATFVITVGLQEVRKEVESFLIQNKVEYFSNITEWARINVKNLVEWNRNWCAFFHIRGMDNYFENAESDEILADFWNKDTTFYKLFSELDLTNVIELACGRGRHVPQYYERAGHITLVDILDKNIEWCKKRFSNLKNISYYCNDGCTLKELPSGMYSALFSYDAVVHFELMDIYTYLQDIFRVLQPGGYVLIHHSNNTEDYRLSFENALHGRNYMSKELFAYLAYRSGFEIVEQEVIDYVAPQLDCISLIRKRV